LPELGRERRIASSQKDGDFVNTDFTYEDMQERNVDKDTHKILREEKVGSYECWVIESVPIDPKTSQYKTRGSPGSQRDLSSPPRGILHPHSPPADQNSHHSRRLEKISGIWTAKEVEMKNSKKHPDDLANHEIKYNKGLPDRMFTRAYLKQAR
jgi:hypothetical protein